MWLEYVFILFIIILLYIYLGYAFILFLLNICKNLLKKNQILFQLENWPEVTLMIPAYNEEDFVISKIKNSLALDYPKNKIKFIWVTDGSTDKTPELVKTYAEIELLHTPERNGKIGAINRGMHFAKTDLVIFTDANTMLTKNAIKEMVLLFENKKVGCVSGEKMILTKEKETASVAGESLYWKYESLLKKWDSNINSTVGAVGELFAIRKNLFSEIEKDTILDDFVISMRIALKGYKIKYAPKAIACESASLNIKEELKRKIRIAAGSLQASLRLKGILNPFKTGFLSFQYFSHKFLRWFIPPFLIPVLFILNLLLLFSSSEIINISFYQIFFGTQCLFYLFVIIGWILQHIQFKSKLFFLPYYIFIANFSQILGFIRYIKGEQSVKWERAKRK